MPRRGKGSRQQQPVQVAPDQTFGERQELSQAQQVIPLPRQADPQPQAQAGPPQQAAATQPSLPELLAAFQPNPTALGSATQRPDEPLTAGLTTGAGAGPEAIRGIRQITLTSDTLQFLADVTGDPAMARFADRARLIGD